LFFVFSNKIYAKWLQNYIWSTDERNYIHQSEMKGDEEESKKAICCIIKLPGIAK
jgi:hypothetical protein